jgi:hypothetical protein
VKDFGSRAGDPKSLAAWSVDMAAALIQDQERI